MNTTKSNEISLRDIPKTATKRECVKAGEAFAASLSESEQMEILAQLCRLETVVNSAKQNLYASLLERLPDEGEEALGVEFKHFTRTTWDYKHDETWQGLKAKLDAHQALMKAAQKKPLDPIFDSDGVQITPAERRSSKPSIKVTF